MIETVIGQLIVVIVAAILAYILVHRWDARMRAADAASLAARPSIGSLIADADAEGDPLPDWDGPIVVNAADLKGLIREAVREAMGPKASAG